ncbi:MAG: ABC transporter permease [Candidatus Cyclobacteriaceae bacterium M3_2C_046]
MLKHHLTLFIRNIKRSRIYFLINLVGLGTGLACSLLIYLWVDDELQINRFHQNDARLFQVMEHQPYTDYIMTTTSTPGILAPELEKEIPEIELATTLTWINTYTLTSGQDHNVKADGYHVSPNFFQTFSYPVIMGDPLKALEDKHAMAISESLAVKLFGGVDEAIGQTVTRNHDQLFKVTAVFEDTPAQTTDNFDFVMPVKDFLDSNKWANSWGNNGPGTVVVLHQDADSEQVSEKIADFIQKREEESRITLFLKPFGELYLFGRYEQGVLTGGRIEYVIIFSAIAVIILVIACINFMNLATARASKKVKEIGIKKSVGAQNEVLVLQFLTESVVTALMALLAAFLLIGLVLPHFNTITDKQISFPMFDLKFLLISLITTIVTGILAGSYPALYLTRFNPANVLKGKLPGSFSEILVRKGLVVFQFFLSIILIVSVIVISEQLSYVQHKNLGYKKENVIRFSREGRVKDNFHTFLEEVIKIPGVKNAAVTGHSLLGRNSNTMGVSWPGKDPEMQILFENVRVSESFLETMGLKMKAGRFFDEAYPADSAKIIFNEAAIKAMGLEDPVGQVVRLWDETDLEIIGVVKDFHFQSLHEPVNPLFFLLEPTGAWNIMVSLDGSHTRETLVSLKEFYQAYNPGFVFDYEFMDENYARMYSAEQRVSILSKYFAGFAVMISCLGLLGLSIFMAERKLKEIGIRKILGSSSWNIVLLLTSNFSKTVFIAILLSIPVSYYMLQQWLNKFAFRIEIQVWYFIIAAVAALLVAWLTVASQAFKAAKVNPVNCLKE